MKFLEFLGKRPPAAAPGPAPAPASAATASERGHAAEDLALAHLQAAALQPPPPPAGAAPAREGGHAAEALALAHLEAAGLQLVARNYRTPGRGGGEIDLVLRDRDRTLVF